MYIYIYRIHDAAQHIDEHDTSANQANQVLTKHMNNAVGFWFLIRQKVLISFF